MSDVLEVLAEARAPAAGPLDREHELSRGGQCLSPVLQLAVSSGAGHEDKLGEYLPEVVERDRVVARLWVRPNSIMAPAVMGYNNPADVGHGFRAAVTRRRSRR